MVCYGMLKIDGSITKVSEKEDDGVNEYVLPHEEKISVGEAFLHLLKHPYIHLIQRWNWKAALLSSIFRAIIFFFTNIVAGFAAAMSAMIVEFAYRGVTAGFYGALTQVFRKARPAWFASITVMIFVPAISHIAEFLVHLINGTKKLGTSIIASVAFSVLSTLFNFYAMRRGVLIVGDQNFSLKEDMRRMPRIIAGFLLDIPIAIYKKLSSTKPVPLPFKSGDKKFKE
ncbi:MAG: hypothetical protein A2Y62_03795 [Candidatus Fischerbacteria bacterium RBG_13_37_8]|uniref:Uncharacterized protein n=1 Tax=Candidatus Fischerbacteria bacterium RBG_13_37_8 TaxID=1817863 RepID=A0A1F5V823_9BACT|nr:MAG: hypothetical protein A2Y62_03795 [Candidatus Fischerbacteria bacterium RBG_13_37_8]